MKLPKLIRALPLAAALCAALSPGLSAATIVYNVILDGPSESPANASPGTGTATITYDTTAHTLRVQTSFSGLVGTTTASHIHAATATPGVSTAGVATTTPTFAGFPLGVTSGTYDNTLDLTLASSYNPAYVTAHGGTPTTAETDLIAAIAAGKAYLNIHSSVFPGGEIRGFLLPAPGNAAPTDISLSNATVAENSAPGSTVGVLSATDADAGDTATFSLVSGTGSADNTSFGISDGTNLVTTASFDFEAKSSYNIRVRVTDSSLNTYEEQFTITVTDVFEPGLTISGGGNVTLQAQGGSMAPTNHALFGTAFAKDVLSNGAFPIHQIPHLNEGAYGNSFSWICNSQNSHAGISFGSTLVFLDQVAFGRDNLGALTDRSLGVYTLQYTTTPNPNASTPDGSWITIGTLNYGSAGGGDFSSPHLRHLYSFTEVQATGFRIKTWSTAEHFNNYIGIDELELYGRAPVIEVQLPVNSVVAEGGSRDFGIVLSGTNAERTFTITNSGTADLTGLGITIAGADASQFTVTTSPTAPVAPEGSTTFAVRFTPTGPGSKSAVLHIANNALGSQNPYDINLSGIGTLALDSVIGGALAGNQFVTGQEGSFDFVNNWPASEPPTNAINGVFTDKYLNFAKFNAGLIINPSAAHAGYAVDALLLWTANDAEGRDPSSYQIYGSPTPLTDSTPGVMVDLSPLTLLGNGAFNLPTNRNEGPAVISFSNDGAYPSYVVVFPNVKEPNYDSENNSMQIAEVALSGHIPAASPDIDVQEIGYAHFGNNGVDFFGQADIGTTNEFVFGITNRGVVNLTGLSVSLSGPDAGDFALGAFAPTTLAPGEGDVLTVSFIPTAAGPRTAYLHITSNDPDEGNFLLVLTGDGFDPLSVPMSTNFTVIGAAEDASVNITLNGTGPAGVPLTFVILVLPQYGTLVGTNDTYTYTPNGNFNGLDNFVYFVTDGTNYSIPTIVEVPVMAINDSRPAIFTPGTNFLAGAQPNGIATAKFDAGTTYDLVVANGLDNTVSLLRGTGNGAFSNWTNFAVGEYPVAVIAADLNRDTRQDIAVVNEDDDSVTVLMLDGAGGILISNLVNLDPGADPVALVAGDFNKDLRIDLATANYDDSSVTIIMNQAGTNFTATSTYYVGRNPTAIAAANLNKDTKLDLVVALEGDDQVAVLTGWGSGTFSNAVYYDLDGSPEAIAVGDFNGDKKLDLAIATVSCCGESQIEVLTNAGNGTFAAASAVSVGYSFITALLAGDYNRDGKLDLVASLVEENAVVVLPGSGTNTFSYYWGDPTTYFPTGTNPVALASATFNKDLYLDLVVANFGQDDVTVLLNNYLPVAFKQAVVAREDTSKTITIVGTYGPLDYLIVNPPTNGSFIATNGVMLNTTNPPTLTYLARPETNGNDRFDFVVTDGVKTSKVARVTIKILPVNDQPSFTLSTNEVTVNEDAVATNFHAFATNVVRGPINEIKQSVKYVLTQNSSNLFSVQPNINAAGKLGFTPRKNLFGDALITARLLDGGGTNNGGTNLSELHTFTIHIQSVNDTPVMANVLGRTTTTNIPAQFNLAVGDLETAAGSLTLSFNSSDTGLVPVANIVQTSNTGTNRIVTVTPATGLKGKSVLTFTVSDGTNAASRSASITVK